MEDLTIGLIEVRDFTAEGWGDPTHKEERARWCCERLEEGEILFFERSPFILPEEDRNFLLNVRQASTSYHKNISYRPGQDRAAGFAKGSADGEKLRLVLRGFSQRLTQSVSELLAPYAQSWQLDFSSFRPFEEQGRQLSLRSRNDLLHVDSFPTRPTNGNRILRAFTNLNQTRPRVWVTAETFQVLAEQWAISAGLSHYAAQARSAFRPLHRSLVRLARSLGIPLKHRSAYDRFMLNFHHYLKANSTIQESCRKWRCEFPPNSSWIVFTDMVPHAVLAGQFALEQTFIVSCDSLLLPDKAPVRILERLCGTRLTN